MRRKEKGEKSEKTVTWCTLHMRLPVKLHGSGCRVSCCAFLWRELCNVHVFNMHYTHVTELLTCGSTKRMATTATFTLKIVHFIFRAAAQIFPFAIFTTFTLSLCLHVDVCVCVLCSLPSAERSNVVVWSLVMFPWECVEMNRNILTLVCWLQTFLQINVDEDGCDAISHANLSNERKSQICKLIHSPIRFHHDSLSM